MDPENKIKMSEGRAWYLVAILTLANLSSFIDRQILALLVKPIKRDLHITDTQVSLLMGLSFALFYTFFGVLIARMADKYNRKNIVTLGVAAWSVMTALCAGVKSYGQFFLARTGVGIGESTLSPSAFSMISDSFKKQRLGLASSVFTMGVFVGSGVAMLIGSMIVAKLPETGTVHLPILGEVFPWQLIFIYIGLPGLVIALLLRTIVEPDRKNVQSDPPANNFISLIDSFKIIFHHSKAYILICLATSCQAFINYGANAWLPTFISRTYGWPVPKAGLYYGLILMTASVCGALAGGWSSDRLIKKGILHGRILISLICGILCLLFSFLPLLPKAEWAILCAFIPGFATAAPYGAAAAALQEMMPNRVRAQAIAILLFILNLIGMGMGPTFVALMTDKVFMNESEIRYSLVSMYLVGSILMIIFSLMAFRPYTRAISSSNPASALTES